MMNENIHQKHALDLIDAVRLATIAHKDQLDKNGLPYIWHPLDVMRRVAEAGYVYTSVLVTAVLHDVVEDTEYTLMDIGDAFGTEVEMAVDAVSRREGEKYRDFVLRAMLHPIGVIVKFHDIQDNLDPKRAVKDKARHLTERYGWAMDQYRQRNFGTTTLYEAMMKAGVK